MFGLVFELVFPCVTLLLHGKT